MGNTHGVGMPRKISSSKVISPAMEAEFADFSMSSELTTKSMGKSDDIGPMTMNNEIKTRKRAATIGNRPHRPCKKKDTKTIPTVFKWTSHNEEPSDKKPNTVLLAGSFNNWSALIPMNSSHSNFVTIIDLPEGQHEYKFKIDGEWRTNVKEPTVQDGQGGLNNVIQVTASDYEVFDALDMDIRDNTNTKHNDSFGQEIPNFNDRYPGGGKNPPILPPHLLQVILNKDTPLSCEPTLLPTPNHVMINHLYALSIKEKVMVMSSTQRYKKKYVTTVLYKPIED